MYSPAFLFAKLTDIGIVSFYFLITGLIAAKILDYLLVFDKTPTKEKSTQRLFFEIFIQIFIIGIVYYLLRNLVERIPSPVNGIGGFNHYRLKELNGSLILGIVLITYSSSLKDKINEFMTRF